MSSAEDAARKHLEEEIAARKYLEEKNSIRAQLDAMRHAQAELDAQYAMRKEWVNEVSRQREYLSLLKRDAAAARATDADALVALKEAENLRRKLENEIGDLRLRLEQQQEALQRKEVDRKQIDELEATITSLKQKQRLAHLLNRVGTAAENKLLRSPAFQRLFEEDTPREAFVMSIDLRRSTELMLKAREPKMFAEFIMILAGQLRGVILENYGVFDKFTGDGILAFFPEFYSGEDAGFFALRAASGCHKMFQEHYRLSRKCFTSVLKDAGLGIGLDFGKVQLVNLGGEFTVVGTPVVYACRMGGAPAGHTYANQPAFEKLFGSYSAYCQFEECEIDLKHEGVTIAYDISMNGKACELRRPAWETDTQAGDGDGVPPQ